jgi:tetratricopeptide (TPR) repeat protein
VDFLLEPFVPGLDVPGILRRLARTNIVSIDRASKTVTLHPIDQDYAYNLLPEEGAYSRSALERRAADYYVQLRTSKETWKTVDDLGPQLFEFEHRVRAEDYDDAWGVVELIDTRLYQWGYYSRLVEMREKLLMKLTNPKARAVNLDRLGRAYQILGDVKQATRLYKEGLAVAREINDRQRELAIVSHLGTVYRTLGQFERAIEYYQQALDIAREIGDRRGEESQLSRLGRTYRFLGAVKQAIKFQEEALSIAREIGTPWSESVRLSRLGNAYLALGQIRQAIDYYEEALAIVRDIGDPWIESYQLLGLSRALLASGSLREARQHCEEALTLGIPELRFQVAQVFGIVLLQEDVPTAEEVFTDAVNDCQVILAQSPDLARISQFKK